MFELVDVFVAAAYGVGAISASAMMLFGSLSIFMMWQIPKAKELVQHRYKQLAAILVFLHIIPTSITSEWHIPANWFGSLPPIGLIGGGASFITIILIWKYRTETDR